MQPETKKLTQKNMPYLTLTLTENLKLQLSPGLVASCDIQPGNGVGIDRLSSDRTSIKYHKSTRSIYTK